MSSIELRTNNVFSNVEVKYGVDQYSCHSHIHSSWSISYVLEGKTMVRLGTWESKLTKNEFITIPPGLPHLCSPIKNSKFKFVVINIPFEYLSHLDFYYKHPRVGKLNTISFENIEQQLLTSKHLDQISQIISELSILLKEYSSEIKDYYGENLLVSTKKEFIDELNNSRFSKYRFHKKKYGIGLKKISTIFKMEHAKKLLLENFELSQIALECGYFDQSHFTKVFKSYTGMNPNYYIKSKLRTKLQ